MKSLLKITTVILAAALVLPACRKSAAPVPAGSLPPAITQGQKDTLQKYGTVFNEGATPPTVSGEFFLDPSVVLFDNSGLNLAGQTADSYVFKFSSQNNSSLTVRVDYRDVSDLDDDDTGSDTSATYISGTGQLFTIYAKINGSVSGVKYTALQIISGEVTSGGIADMQVTSQLLSKNGDPGNQLLYPVGSINIVYDADKLSVPYTGVITFSVLKVNAAYAAKAHPPGKAMLFIK
jgi:hypothetical protein